MYAWNMKLFRWNKSIWEFGKSLKYEYMAAAKRRGEEEGDGVVMW